MLEEIRADLRSEPGKPASVKQAKEETAEVEQPDNVTVWHSVATRSEDTTHKATTVYSSEGESVSEEDTNNNEQAVEENNSRFHWRRWEETSSWARSSASDGKEDAGSRTAADPAAESSCCSHMSDWLFQCSTTDGISLAW